MTEAAHSREAASAGARLLSPFARGHLAMLLFSFLIAGSFTFGTRIAGMMEPVPLMALRFALAGVLVGALAAASRRMRARHFRAPWRFLVLGGLFAGYFVLMFEGLKTANPVSASAVFTLTPAMTAVFGWWLLRQRTTPWMAAALAVGAAGAVWVIFGGDLHALLRFEIGRGEAIYFLGCILHAIYTPMVRKLNRGEPALVFTFGMIVCAFLLLALPSAPTLVSFDYAAQPPIFWIGLLYLSVFTSAATFFLLQFATMILPSANVMAYTYLTPSWVILWELVFGGGLPQAAVWAGVAATVVALLMLLRR